MTNLKILEFSRGHSYKMWTEQRIGPITILGCTVTYPVSVYQSHLLPLVKMSHKLLFYSLTLIRSSVQERTEIHNAIS